MPVEMEEITGQLQKIDLFRTVEISDLEALVTAMQEETYPEGTVLFRAGEIGEAMYIIRSGRIRIYTHDLNGREITLTHYAQNEVFGELSPIDRRPRSASAAVIEPAKIFMLRREDLLNLLNERPQIGLAMIRNLTHLLRNTTTFLEEFRPESFVTPKEDHGAEFRRGATGLIASIIDGIDASEEEKEPISREAVEKTHLKQSSEPTQEKIEKTRKNADPDSEST
ncbi:MAG TPA: cyclic nucleotide-binding domain-containing protein [Aggregatilineales bacterium]|nr:cyclic nucleotide-binding domain-containing protein [Aggregatilineales bacterium]